eukprot:UN11552
MYSPQNCLKWIGTCFRKVKSQNFQYFCSKLYINYFKNPRGNTYCRGTFISPSQVVVNFDPELTSYSLSSDESCCKLIFISVI